MTPQFVLWNNDEKRKMRKNGEQRRKMTNNGERWRKMQNIGKRRISRTSGGLKVQTSELKTLRGRESRHEIARVTWPRGKNREIKGDANGPIRGHRERRVANEEAEPTTGGAEPRIRENLKIFVEMRNRKNFSLMVAFLLYFFFQS